MNIVSWGERRTYFCVCNGKWKKSFKFPSILLGQNNFLSTFLPRPFFRGPFFQGTIFPGTIFPGTFFPRTLSSHYIVLYIVPIPSFSKSSHFTSPNLFSVYPPRFHNSSCSKFLFTVHRPYSRTFVLLVLSFTNSFLSLLYFSLPSYNTFIILSRLFKT